jgi:hypothetical protein
MCELFIGISQFIGENYVSSTHIGKERDKLGNFVLIKLPIFGFLLIALQTLISPITLT